MGLVLMSEKNKCPLNPTFKQTISIKVLRLKTNYEINNEIILKSET